MIHVVAIITAKSGMREAILREKTRIRGELSQAARAHPF